MILSKTGSAPIPSPTLGLRLMEAPMGQRPDHPRLHVQLSFETTRIGPQCLIDAYMRLVPIRRTSLRKPEPYTPLPISGITSRCGGEHG